MYTLDQFAEDAADPLVVQLGPESKPANLTGAQITLRLKDRASGQVYTSTATVLTPATAGRVSAPWPANALVAGRVFDAEFVVQAADTSQRTYPGPAETPLIVRAISRRTGT